MRTSPYPQDEYGTGSAASPVKPKRKSHWEENSFQGMLGRLKYRRVAVGPNTDPEGVTVHMALRLEPDSAATLVIPCYLSRTEAQQLLTDLQATLDGGTGSIAGVILGKSYEEQR